MANKPNIVKAIGNQLGTTLASGINASDTSITVSDGAGFSSDGGYIIIDENVAGKEEIVYVESASGATLTIATDGRGRCGTSATSHDAGATVSDILVDDHINGIADKFLIEHSDSGGHGVLNLTTPTLTNPTITNGTFSFNAPQGYLINGRIITSVSSNNLTVALKTLSGDDPSASNPVYCRIGDAVRSITSALSVTKSAGTNWFNCGAEMHATYEVDYFVYLGYNATDGVVIGFSRLAHCRLYGDFSASPTDERYCAISTITNATSTDNYELVGRFNAVLSASPSYNWSIPATSIVINRPIFETRSLTFLPSLYGGTVAGTTTWTSRLASYKIVQQNCYVTMYITWSNQTGSGDMYIGLPHTCGGGPGTFSSLTVGFATGLTDPGGFITSLIAYSTNALRLVNANGVGSSYYAIDAAGSIIVGGIYPMI
jgi:hypothetical protein